MIKLIILDDHELVGLSIKSILDKEKDLVVKKVLKNPESLESYIKLIKPNVILCDIKLKDINGIDIIKRYKRIYPEIKFIVLSGYNLECFKARAFQEGASAYVLKEDTTTFLIDVIRNVYHNNYDTSTNNEFIMSELTITEIEVLGFMAKDLTNIQISKKTFISKRNVEYHISRIIKKLNVNSRLGAVVKGIRLGLVEEEEIHPKNNDW